MMARRKRDVGKEQFWQRVMAEWRNSGVWYQPLYAIEKEAKKRSEDEHLDGNAADELPCRLRQNKALPLWTSFRNWLEEQRAAVLPKNPMGQAISYTLGNWDALVRHTYVTPSSAALLSMAREPSSV